MERVVRGVIVALMLLGMSGCLSRYALEERPVVQMSDAERRARSGPAFERARRRAQEVQAGMSMREVQVVMGAVIAVEEASGDSRSDQRKLMDGFLCRVNPSPLTERWLFGFDEGNVLLVGLAIEFERDDPESDDWSVRRVDKSPRDDCPIVGNSFLD